MIEGQLLMLAPSRNLIVVSGSFHLQEGALLNRGVHLPGSKSRVGAFVALAHF